MIYTTVRGEGAPEINATAAARISRPHEQATMLQELSYSNSKQFVRKIGCSGDGVKDKNW